MKELVIEFLQTVLAEMDDLNEKVIELEENKDDQNLIDAIFRLLHSIKGTAGFLEFLNLQGIAHKAEDLLQLYRGDVEMDEEGVTLILESFDAIKKISEDSLAGIGADDEEATEIANSDDHVELLEKLVSKYQRITSGDDAAPEKESGAEESDVAPKEEAAEEVASTPEEEEKVKPEPVKVSPPPAPKEAAPKAKAKAPSSKGKSSGGADPVVKVQVSRIDKMMDLAGELVLVRNQIQQSASEQLATPLQSLSNIVSELQESVMKTRMQPIGSTFTTHVRTVRDISKTRDKKIKLERIGEQTEVDRQVLDAIRDPLTHMIRNSADHGIETPAARIAAGKPEEGTITLRAYHEGGHIIINVEDDGAGIPVDKISKKVLEKGLATEEQLDRMSPNQIRAFIFAAGFSTAEQITDVSGRGVGMDVVRSNIEGIGGTVTIDSIEGSGTTFSIKIPLTLAIVRAFIVGVGDQKFALPQTNVLEMIDPRTPGGSFTIDCVNGARLLRTKGQLYPIIDIAEVLGIEGAERKAIIVCQLGHEIFGLQVDEVHKIEEIVVKPLSTAIQDTRIYSGNTIMGDGSVIMIVDPIGFLAEFSAYNDMPEQDAVDTGIEEITSDVLQMVLFQAGGKNPKAVHLSVISRIDRAKTSDIVVTDDGKLQIQVAGHLMPVVCPEGLVVDYDKEHQEIIIFDDDEKSMGLLVDKIDKIVKTSVNIDMISDAHGIVGSAIINGEPTEVIDINYYLDKALKNWFQDRERIRNTMTNFRVLVVDDNAFFRNILQSMLDYQGYDVVAVESGEEVLQLLETQDFDILLSDIEMPEMTGLELIKKVRMESPQKGIHSVAISAHAADSDRKAGLDAGFNDYVSKEDRESILDYLKNIRKENSAKAEKNGK